MFKSWLIAAGVFIVGMVAAVIMGRAKQHASDSAKVSAVVKTELDKISGIAEKAKDDVSKLPDTGPASSPEQLHDDWNEGKSGS